MTELDGVYANNVALAGLYLMPDREAYFRDRKMPPLLKRMVDLEGGLSSTRARARWMHTWFKFMPDPAGDGDPWNQTQHKAAWAIGHVGSR